MSYIAFDLDALNEAPAVARFAGVSEDLVIAGMARMWAWCFREKVDIATTGQVRGLFGADLTEALSEFGYLEPDEDSAGHWRVRGADRYLRVAEGRSKGGKAAAANGNLKRGMKRDVDEVVAGTVDAQPQLPPSSLPALPPASAQLAPRLSPSTEHRAPNTEKLASSGDEFFAWAQRERHAALGLPDEKPPVTRELSAWFSEALMQLDGDLARLNGAYLAFLANPFWNRTGPKRADKPCPWSGWVSQWRDHVTAKPKPHKVSSSATPLELAWRDRLKKLPDAYVVSQLEQLVPDHLEGVELVVTTDDEFFADHCRETYATLLPGVRIEHRSHA